MTRTVQETRSIDTTQGALYKAARIARELASRLEQGADYLRDTRSADGGRLVPLDYQQTYATETRDTLRTLLQATDDGV